MSRQFLALLGAMLVLSGCAGKQASAGPTVVMTTPVSPGQAIFLNQCVRCHRGPGSPPNPNDIILQSDKLTDEAAFLAYLRDPNPGMPPFDEKKLDKPAVHELYTFIQKIKSTQPQATSAQPPDGQPQKAE